MLCKQFFKNIYYIKVSNFFILQAYNGGDVLASTREEDETDFDKTRAAGGDSTGKNFNIWNLNI